MATPTITIPQGATLSGIARERGTTVAELMRLNPQITDPNIIRVGATLILPTVQTPQHDAHIRAREQHLRRQTPAPAPTLPPAQVPDPRTEIQRIEREIAKRQEAIRLAEARGIPPTETIPANILEQAGLRNIPPTPTLPNIVGHQATLQQIQEAIGQQTAERMRMLGEEKVEQKAWYQRMFGRAEAVETPQPRQVYEETLRQWGVTPEVFELRQNIIGQIAQKNQEIARIDTETQLEIARQTQLGMPMDYITRKQRFIEWEGAIRKSGVAAEANVLAAQDEAIRGNIEMAQSFAQVAVNLAVQEYELNINAFERLFTLGKDYMEAMNKSEREIWELSMEWNKNMLAVKTEEENNRIGLIIDAAQKGVQLPSNLNFQETLNAFTRIIPTRVAAQEALQRPAWNYEFREGLWWKLDPQGILPPQILPIGELPVDKDAERTKIIQNMWNSIEKTPGISKISIVSNAKALLTTDGLQGLFTDDELYSMVNSLAPHLRRGDIRDVLQGTELNIGGEKFIRQAPEPIRIFGGRREERQRTLEKQLSDKEALLRNDEKKLTQLREEYKKAGTIQKGWLKLRIWNLEGNIKMHQVSIRDLKNTLERF